MEPKEPADDRDRVAPRTAGPRPTPVKSFGNMGPDHWSKARADSNAEALEYYRRRSHAPGVAEGGAARNVYCLACDGVVPFSTTLTRCPHCGEDLSGAVQRYFNWVEINEPPASDARALLPFALAGVALLALAAWALWWWVGS